MKKLLPAVLALTIGAATLAVATAPIASASAQTARGVVAERPRDAAVHVLDGEVRSIAQVGNTVVMGGTFTQIGPVTRGALGLVDTTTSSFGAGLPDVVGRVAAVASDGAGGWYVGGQFTSVGGQARTNLAHVDAGGAVTAFAPNPNGSVTSLVARPGGGVYAAGDFTTFGGVTAKSVAAVDGTDALVWGANVMGGVSSLALAGDGSTLYLGGAFSKIDNVTTNRLGAVLTATGARAAAFAPGVVNGTVTALAVWGTTVVLGGDFTKVNGVTRQHLATVDGSTGALGTLATTVNNSVKDLEIDQVTGTAYLAGTFGNVGASSRVRLAGVDLATGAVTGLSVPSISGTVTALALDGAGSLFIGGPLQITPERDNPAMLAKVNLSTNAVTAVVPYAQTPRSLARAPLSGASGPAVLAMSGTSLLVGGDFSDYGARTQRYLAAYDLTTGALSNSFVPAPDAAVYTVKATKDNTGVFIGGEFTVVAGISSARIAKIRLSDGAAYPGFAASATSYVKDMAVSNDGASVYVGGNFDHFNGVAASRLTKIDATTGAMDPTFHMDLTDPTNDSGEGGLRAMALSPDGTKLMVIGNFRTIGGVARPLIAQLDVSVSPNLVTPWHTDVYDQPCSRGGKIGWMRDVDISPDGQTAYVVSSGHFYYPACDSANAFPMADAGASSVVPLWTDRIGDTMETVAAAADAVYIGGHFKFLDTETHSERRFQIAALNPTTGKGLNWIPQAGGFRGVLTIENEPAGLFAGSDGDAFGGVNHGRNAFWPKATPGIEVRKDGDRRFSVQPGGTAVWTMHVMNTSAQPVTLTSLVDSVIGDLSAAGTCSVPQTIAVGAEYACTVSQAVAGAPGSEVNTGTVTAQATGQDATVYSDSDTAYFTITFADPKFRIRVSTIGQSTFPGGYQPFAISLMNLDPVRPVTLNSLVSPQFGDVSAACGLPRVLNAYLTLSCHLSLPVDGPVGSQQGLSFTGTGTFATGQPIQSVSSATVTMVPPVGGSKLLVVVANPLALNASDVKLRDRLSGSYSLTFVDDNTVQAADVTADYSAVIVGPSTVPAKLGTRLAGVATPVLVTHSQMLDEMGMTSALGNGSSAPGTTWTVTTGRHALAAAKAGVQTVNSSALAITWGTPAASADVVGQLVAGQATEFAYDAGDLMDVSAAPGCRVFFAAGNMTKFTATAYTLFDRAVAYAVYGCGQNMLWTAAGNGTTTFGGEGAQSVNSGLASPWGVAIDGQGRVYVTDTGNNAVRRIDADGTVHTVAGTGVAGFSGDGGPATAAKLNTPVRLTFDATGNLYIADSANGRIRKVALDGTITTVAGNGVGFSGDGGQALVAKFRQPYDVAFAADGTMYIADRGNHRVRKVGLDGVVTTVAGTGTAGYNGDDIAATTARLNNPYSVAVDAAGRLYIADYDNERVRVVEGGQITTFAGTGIPTADGDGGPATEAGLHKPQYVQVLPNQDVLVSESNNNDVRIVHEGQMSTLAGSREFGYLGDGGTPLLSTWSRPSATALAPNGQIWVVDRNNKRLRVINPTIG